MLDARTFFVALFLTCLVFALSSAATVSFRFRDGVGKWTMGLLMQAAVYALYGARGVWPDTVSVVVANGLFALALSLHAAALLEFYGRRLHTAWLVVPALIVLVVLRWTLADDVFRTVFSGAFFGAAMLAIAILVHRVAPPSRPARWMVMVGFLLGGCTFALRGMLVFVDIAGLKDLMAPTPLQMASLASGLVTLLLTSIGFILLQLERAEESARKLAVIDPLTAVFNRRTFLELADKEVARAQRTQSPLSLIMIDIDHFKQINDENGHQAGDEVLRRAVEAMKLCLRREDLLVRYGGEEFCILVPGVGVDQATLLAERYREAIQKLRIPVNDNVLAVTISAGVTAMRRSAEDTIEQMVARADEALYLAKKAGRNRVISVPENTTIALLARSQQLSGAVAAQADLAQPSD
jgi:diguanylate cyclase (GGDEF)-like protein